MGCSHCHDHESHEHLQGINKEQENRIILYIRIAISSILLILGLILKNEAFKIILFITSYVIIAYDVIVNAILNIFKGKFFDEAFLMSLATILAIVINEYFEAVAVMLFYQIGELLQDMAVDKSKDSIAKLLDNDIKEAMILENDVEKVINVNDLKVNDVVIIKSGEKIPIDGQIIKGKTSLNMASLTGESIPKKVTEGDEVLSGSINLEQVIYVKVNKIYQESTAYKVAQVIKESSHKKANSEKFITKFSKVYTPVVIFLVLIIAFVLPLITGWQNFEMYLNRALTFLVISCPCALVISIPLSFFAGIGKNASKGILVKGANSIEMLAKVNQIAFDKTGTITRGNFEVVKVDSNDERLMLDLLYSIESKFTHPIAKSILRYCNNQQCSGLEITEINDLPGKGVSGNYKNNKVLIGNEKLLSENNIKHDKVDDVGSVVYVAYDNKYLGYLLIEDELKENIKEDINNLKNIGITEMYLISGDNKEIVSKVATSLDINNSYADMLPEDKLNVVQDIIKNKNEKDYLAYCGDGINDAAVLLESDVGIAMGLKGSDLTISAADVVLMNDNLSSIKDGINVSKKTMKIVKQNIIFILFIKVIVMILGGLGYAPMLLAIFADVGVSLLAILNSLRVMYGKVK